MFSLLHNFYRLSRHRPHLRPKHSELLCVILSSPMTSRLSPILSDSRRSYPISTFRLTEDSQDLSKEEMMRVARFYLRKTRSTTPKALAIKSARVTAIRDSRSDRRSRTSSLGAIALIRRTYVLSRDLLLTTPTLRGLSNHRQNRRTARYRKRLSSATSDHRLAGYSRRNFAPDPCRGSSK